MSKRKSGDIATDSSDMSLQREAMKVYLETPEGLALVLRQMNKSEPLRQSIKSLGSVVAKKDAVEKLMHDMQSLDRRATNRPSHDQREAFVTEIAQKLAQDDKIGIDMQMAEKKTRFEGACVSQSRYGYSSVRNNLSDGMVHIMDEDTYQPWHKQEESWHTYTAGPEGCTWAKQVLEALNVPTDQFIVLPPQRVVSIKWRPDTSEGIADQDEDNDDY